MLDDLGVIKAEYVKQSVSRCTGSYQRHCEEFSEWNKL